MLQIPPAGTTIVPNTVVPFGPNKVMVLPGVPVPVMAGLALLVILSVLLVPVSFVASCVSVAVRSGTGITLIVALAAGDVVPLLSVTVNGIFTMPLKLAAGINSMLAACAGDSAKLTGNATGGVAGLPSLS